MLLGIDVGSTHCKAGLFREDGTACGVATRPTIVHRSGEGYTYIEPEELWETVAAAIRQVTESADDWPIAAVGIASMAETGVLIDRVHGSTRSMMIPWFDTAAQPQADWIKAHSDPLERFVHTGIRSSFKVSMAKLLWLESREPGITRNGTWLSAADYIAYRLTGRMATDYSLATRTYAFRIDQREWDTDWIRSLGLPGDLFPEAHSSGTPFGTVTREAGGAAGIGPGAAVAVGGHDHVCAAVALGAITPGRVLNSMGTAESLMGAMTPRRLTEKEFASGLVFGCHAAPAMNYWMGGLSASGRSVEWLRGILGDPPLSYSEIETLLAESGAKPSGILYFPYLLGNQSRAPNAHARAAFIGLTDSHRRSDLVKAVLEGTAMEMEVIRAAAEQVGGASIERMAMTGGGTRNRRWLEIKADVSGCTLDVSPVSEATLLGAALLAGVGAGVYSNIEQALDSLAIAGGETIAPDPARHAEYRRIFEQDYSRFQEVINRSK